jgi:hypothetical protein
LYFFFFFFFFFIVTFLPKNLRIEHLWNRVEHSTWKNQKRTLGEQGRMLKEH